jgi:enoyl-CoA hydratase/carnithine racemase
LTSRRNEVGIISLNRPHRANAFDHEMLDLWVKAIAGFAADDGVKAIVTTGMGTAFCAGVDLAELDPDEDEHAFLRRLRNGAHRVANEMFRLEKPMIAAMNGGAVGAGLDMALMCDIRIAADSARLSAGYIRLGLFPGNGGTYLLPRLVGQSRALEMLWTGKAIDGRHAAQIGIVSHAVPKEQVLDAAIDLAHEISQMDPDVVTAIKRSVYANSLLSREAAFDVIAAEAAAVRGLPATRARIRAAREARAHRDG